ncbi:hypothetical protein ACFX15_038557 [Malus domestica]
MEVSVATISAVLVGITIIIIARAWRLLSWLWLRIKKNEGEERRRRKRKMVCEGGSDRSKELGRAAAAAPQQGMDDGEKQEVIFLCQSLQKWIAFASSDFSR